MCCGWGGYSKKIAVLMDNGYHKEKLEKELKTIYPQIVNKIRLKVIPKPTDTNNPSFKPVHKRWVVKRANARSQKCGGVWKNCEKLINTSVAKLQRCSIRLEIKILAKG